MDMLYYQLQPDTTMLREQRAEEYAAYLERELRSLQAWPFPGSRVVRHGHTRQRGTVIESYSLGRHLVADVQWDLSEKCGEFDPQTVGIIDLDVEPGSCRD